MSYRLVDCLLAGAKWNSSISCPLASSQRTYMTLTWCWCVQSWTSDDGRKDRPKHVEWYSINSKNCASSWFYYRNYTEHYHSATQTHHAMKSDSPDTYCIRISLSLKLSSNTLILYSCFIYTPKFPKWFKQLQDHYLASLRARNDLQRISFHLGISWTVFVLICTVVVLYCFVMCVCVCVCEFCNVCVCVGFVMCGCFGNMCTVLRLRFFLPWRRFFRAFSSVVRQMPG
jgi:hypothetical protein